MQHANIAVQLWIRWNRGTANLTKLKCVGFGHGPPARHCTNDACNWAKVRWGVSHFYTRSQCKARLWQQIKIYKCISKYVRKIYYSGHNSWRSTMLAGHLLSASNNLRWQQTYCLSAFLGRPCGWWLYLAPTPPLTAWRSCSYFAFKAHQSEETTRETTWKRLKRRPNHTK